MAKWGYTRSGARWCDTCGGDETIPCSQVHVDGQDCTECDFGYDGITAETAWTGCPTCNSTDNQANLANYSERQP